MDKMCIPMIEFPNKYFLLLTKSTWETLEFDYHIQIQEKYCLSKRFSRGKIGLDGTRSNVISFRVELESLNWQKQKISEKEVLNRTHL